MWKLERARDPRITWVSLLGLILVPLLVSGGFLWATWNSDNRLDRVQAAIVNLDEGTTLNGQFVPLGRQLAGGLVNGEDGVGNFDWVLTDSEDGARGLANGAYTAVVTIPADFSRRATSFSKSDVAEIEPAEIDVATSQVSGIADPVVGQVITTAARDALNTELTEQYLDNIYLGFNSTKKQFQSVATGARQLADGAGGLSDGLDQTSTGAKKLADGLEQLDDGTQQLSTGMTKLADGTKELPSQTRQLADGAQQSADGAGDLADGVKQYVGGVKQLDKQLPTFTKGLGQTADGAEKLADGTRQLSTGMKQYAAGSRQFAAGLQQYSQTMSTMTPGTLEAIVPCPDEIEAADACETFYAGAVAGTKIAGGGLDAENGDNPSLIDSADSLASNASTISTNLTKISTGVDGLSDGLSQLDTGAGKIEDGVDRLAENGTKLATGTKSLAGGLDQLADGTDKLATGLTTLSSGIQQTADGTQELATGTSQSASGGRQLSDGIVKLADGGSRLADGSDDLATGLEKGAKQIPTYDKQERTALSSVVATPVTAERPGSLFADIANTTFLSVIALWLGGLASFVVLRAIPSRVLTSMKPSWRLAGDALLPAAGVAVVQAIALTVTLQILLDLSAVQVAQLLPFLLLAGLAFVGINHALVAWLGGFGRFLSVATVVLSAATAITDAVPPFLAQVVPFLPLTPALEGVRAIASGGPGAGGSAGLLVAWLVVGLAAGVLAVARQRVARIPQVVPVRG
ncbi:MAG TPA: YhgE/Pip domain-containing protein [Microlunatus sp.]|nr:YhgE/Pip domain-containing protein [Microlunatus sp.]